METLSQINCQSVGDNLESKPPASLDLVNDLQKLSNECKALYKMIVPDLDRDGGIRHAYKQMQINLDALITKYSPQNKLTTT